MARGGLGGGLGGGGDGGGGLGGDMKRVGEEWGRVKKSQAKK